MFYGGDIVCIQGQIQMTTLDKILDMIDRYIELIECLEEEEDDRTRDR